MIERIFDDDTGIIYVTGRGVWNRQAVDVHYASLRGMIDDLRSRGAPIRVLSDVSAAPRQDHDLERHILGQISRTFQERDRFAILTADMADKAYARASAGHANIMVFASKLPAEQWLLWDELPRAG